MRENRLGGPSRTSNQDVLPDQRFQNALGSWHERDENVVADLGYERIARDTAAEVLHEADARRIVPSSDRQGSFRECPTRLTIPTAGPERHR